MVGNGGEGGHTGGWMEDDVRGRVECYNNHMLTTMYLHIVA